MKNSMPNHIVLDIETKNLFSDVGGKENLTKVHTLRRMLDMIPEDERTETIKEKLLKFEKNQEFLDSLKTA